MKLVVNRCELGAMPTNCYIVRDMGSGDSLVIDPAVYDVTLVAALRKLEIKSLRYILLTHGHFDHILGVQKLQDKCGGALVIHAQDETFLHNDGLSLRPPFSDRFSRAVTPDLTVRDGDRLPFGKGEIEVLHTPGHTAGSVCYLLDDLLFSGDTLFRESVGRTDFPTGSLPQLRQSVRRIAALRGDYKLFPGHGEVSTLSHERKNNPYLYYAL